MKSNPNIPPIRRLECEPQMLSSSRFRCDGFLVCKLRNHCEHDRPCRDHSTVPRGHCFRPLSLKHREHGNSNLILEPAHPLCVAGLANNLKGAILWVSLTV